MKLGEALAERKDLTQRIKRLSDRLENNARVREGEEPSEDPATLRQQLTDALDQLQQLTVDINLTNVTATIEGGETIVQAIARRDRLNEELKILRELAGAASPRERYSRYDGDATKMVTTIDVKALQQEIDEKSREWRQLDTRLQAANFSVDLHQNGVS